MRLRFVLALFIGLLSVPVPAATKTVTLSVPGMTCAACPITVETALNNVAGVSRADASYPDREAEVTFDDTRTSVKALTQATANAGYPATVKTEKTDQE